MLTIRDVKEVLWCQDGRSPEYDYLYSDGEYIYTTNGVVAVRRMATNIPQFALDTEEVLDAIKDIDGRVSFSEYDNRIMIMGFNKQREQVVKLLERRKAKALDHHEIFNLYRKGFDIQLVFNRKEAVKQLRGIKGRNVLYFEEKFHPDLPELRSMKYLPKFFCMNKKYMLGFFRNVQRDEVTLWYNSRNYPLVYRGIIVEALLMPVYAGG